MARDNDDRCLQETSDNSNRQWLNSWLYYTSQLRCGALPAVLAPDKDFRESKFSANFISCIAALHDRVAGNHGGIVIDIYHLVMVGNRFVGRRVGLDAVEVLRPA